MSLRAGIVASIACAFVACTGGSVGFGPYVYDDPSPSTYEHPPNGADSPANSREAPGATNEHPATSTDNPGTQGGGAASGTCAPCDEAVSCKVPVTVNGNTTTYTAKAQLTSASGGCTLTFTDQGTDKIPPLTLTCDGKVTAYGQTAGTWTGSGATIVLDVQGGGDQGNGVSTFTCSKSATQTVPPTPTSTPSPAPPPTGTAVPIDAGG